MPATRVKMVYNRLPRARTQLATQLQTRTDKAAGVLRDALKKELQGGNLPIQSDTHALAQSLSVQTPTSSDADARTAAAEAEYVKGGRWRDPVNEALGVDAYTAEHFAERRAQEESLPAQADTYYAAVLTLLAWGYWWEMGHSNEFTGRYEHRVWMTPFVMQWWLQHAAQSYEGMIK